MAALKAESRNKETQDRVRKKAPVTTKLVEIVAKLKQQIAQLMAALIQVELDSGITSAPDSPLEFGHGHGCSGGSSKSTKCFVVGEGWPYLAGSSLQPSILIYGRGHRGSWQ